MDPDKVKLFESDYDTAFCHSADTAFTEADAVIEAVIHEFSRAFAAHISYNKRAVLQQALVHATTVGFTCS